MFIRRVSAFQWWRLPRDHVVQSLVFQMRKPKEEKSLPQVTPKHPSLRRSLVAACLLAQPPSCFSSPHYCSREENHYNAFFTSNYVRAQAFVCGFVQVHKYLDARRGRWVPWSRGCELWALTTKPKSSGRAESTPKHGALNSAYYKEPFREETVKRKHLKVQITSSQ